VGIGQQAASAIRAVQALEGAGPLSDANRVEELIDWGGTGTLSVLNYTSVEDLRRRAISGMLDSFMAQLSAAQKTPEGREVVLNAVAALAGDRGLEDLRAAGELAPFGQPVLTSPFIPTEAQVAKYGVEPLSLATNQQIENILWDAYFAQFGTPAEKQRELQALQQKYKVTVIDPDFVELIRPN